MTLFMSETEIQECDNCLKSEGLEHLIGHVKYTLNGDTLLVDPITDHAFDFIGEGEFLEFTLVVA